jgi:hypothetical protein
MASAQKQMLFRKSIDIFILSNFHPLLLTFYTLANIVIALKILLSIIDLLIFTFSGAFIVVYGIVVLSLLNTKTAGILTLIVDISHPLLLYWALLINPSLTLQVYLHKA